MLISELPPEYQELAKKRRREQVEGYYKDNSDHLVSAFHWGNTPEGKDFWNVCNRAKKLGELPDIDLSMRRGSANLDKFNLENKKLLLQ